MTDKEIPFDEMCRGYNMESLTVRRKLGGRGGYKSTVSGECHAPCWLKIILYTSKKNWRIVDATKD